MKGIILGSPGSGKGTQGQKLCEELGIPQISTGDMLRAAIRDETALGKQAKEYMKRGELLPDQVIIDLVKVRISQNDCKNGFLLDGFPRNIVQAKALYGAGVELDAVIELQVPDEEIIIRLTGRRVHLPSGRSYHVEFNPPLQNDIDDETGEQLSQREDDKIHTIKNRLKIYHNLIDDLRNFYKFYAHKINYCVVDGVGNLDQIFMRIKTGLN